jgi:hypothetical protein
VRRWWSGPAREPAPISPALLRLALTLLAAGQPVVVALDTTRPGRWEICLAGIIVAGRTLPIGWAVIPYPWPQGRFQATTLTLGQATPEGLPGWDTLEAGGRARLPKRRVLCAHLHQGRPGGTVCPTVDSQRQARGGAGGSNRCPRPDLAQP